MTQELWEFIWNNKYLVAFGTITLIQVAPIKIDPWTHLLKWVKRIVIGDLETEIKDMRRDFDKEKAERLRWNILDFANSVRNNRPHSREEWKHAISQLKVYESFCEIKGIENGVIEEDGKYLREKYHEHNMNNDFL